MLPLTTPTPSSSNLEPTQLLFPESSYNFSERQLCGAVVAGDFDSSQCVDIGNDEAIAYMGFNGADATQSNNFFFTDMAFVRVEKGEANLVVNGCPDHEYLVNGTTYFPNEADFSGSGCGGCCTGCSGGGCGLGCGSCASSCSSSCSGGCGSSCCSGYDECSSSCSSSSCGGCSGSRFLACHACGGSCHSHCGSCGNGCCGGGCCGGASGCGSCSSCCSSSCSGSCYVSSCGGSCCGSCGGGCSSGSGCTSSCSSSCSGGGCGSSSCDGDWCSGGCCGGGCCGGGWCGGGCCGNGYCGGCGADFSSLSKYTPAYYAHHIKLPLNPTHPPTDTPPSTTYSISEHTTIGVTISGVPLESLPLVKSFDSCMGHVEKDTHQYHYHTPPICLLRKLGIPIPNATSIKYILSSQPLKYWPQTSVGPDPIVGYALDGHPIKGPYDANGNLVLRSSLDR